MDCNYWIIKSPSGALLPSTFSETKSETLIKFLSLVNKKPEDLEFLEEQGYTAFNVRIEQLNLFSN